MMLILAGIPRRWLPSAVMGALLLQAGPVLAEKPPQPVWHEAVPGELLVRFQPSTGARNKSSVRSLSKARLNAHYPAFGIERWRLQDPSSARDTLRSLRNHPEVAFAEPNYRRYPRANIEWRPNDPEYLDKQQLFYENSLGLNLPAAWGQVTDAATAIVRVAVIDDAIDIQHDELRNNIAPNTDSNYTGPSSAADFDGTADDNDPSPGQCTDSISGVSALEEHGTLVANVLTADTNNAAGMAGIARNAKLIPIGIGCNLTVADELQGFQHAIKQGAHIINVSWGGPQFSEAERWALEMLDKEDILVVAAAGNHEVSNDRVPDYPSGLDFPNIISVAATTSTQNDLVRWSQYGQTSVDIATLGQDVLTYYPTAKGISAPVYAEGTSFAAPIVAGTAALLKAKKPTATMHDLKGAMMATARPLQNTIARLATDGSLDAEAAMNAIDNPRPVIVVHSLRINDDQLGNANGEIDPGETVDLNITLENVWKAADNNVEAQIQLADNSNVLSIESGRQLSFGAMAGESGQRVARTLRLKAGEFVGHHRVPFALLISADGENFNRHFELELGVLHAGQTVEGELRAALNEQDDFHYYRIDVDESAASLVLDLQAVDGIAASNDMDMMVSYGKPPQFDYKFYLEGEEYVDYGVRVSQGSGYQDRVEIANPRAGSYYIMVMVRPLGERDNPKMNIRYQLSSSVTEIAGRQVAAGGGCSLSSRPGQMDISLPLLFFLSLSYLLIRRKSHHAPGG